MDSRKRRFVYESDSDFEELEGYLKFNLRKRREGTKRKQIDPAQDNVAESLDANVSKAEDLVAKSPRSPKLLSPISVQHSSLESSAGSSLALRETTNDENTSKHKAITIPKQKVTYGPPYLILRKISMPQTTTNSKSLEVAQVSRRRSQRIINMQLRRPNNDSVTTAARVSKSTQRKLRSGTTY